jgi:hypothetical protein
VKYYYDKAALAGMNQELSTIDWEEKLSIQDENKQNGHFFPEGYNIQYRKSFHLHLILANQEREVHGQYVHEFR